MYGTRTQASQYDGDLIIEDGDVTYIGRIKPGYPRGTSDAPVEEQPVWQIERIDTGFSPRETSDEEETELTDSEIEPTDSETEPNTEQDAATEEAEEEPEDYIYITRRQYPDGNEDYKFKISEARSYTYEYRH